MNFSLLDRFVDHIKQVLVVNYEMLDKYRKLLEDKRLPEHIKNKTAGHHSLPKSEAKALKIPEGVYNADWNYVELYHRDHVLAHYYLALALPTKRLCWAAKTMLNNASLLSITEAEAIKISEEYALVAEKVNEFAAEHLKDRYVSPETREKNRQGRLGKKDSEKSRKKKSIARIGMVVSEEVRAKHRRENLSEEQRKNLSAGHKPFSEQEKMIRSQRMQKLMANKPKLEAHKIKLAEANSGKRWYNNGVVEIQIDATDNAILDGFVLGKLPSYGKRSTGLRNPNSGNIKWTNGKIEVRSKVCPGDGFVKGSLSSYEPPQDLFDYGGL